MLLPYRFWLPSLDLDEINRILDIEITYPTANERETGFAPMNTNTHPAVSDRERNLNPGWG
jgi:hypothetical protein